MRGMFVIFFLLPSPAFTQISLLFSFQCSSSLLRISSFLDSKFLRIEWSPSGMQEVKFLTRISFVRDSQRISYFMSSLSFLFIQPLTIFLRSWIFFTILSMTLSPGSTKRVGHTSLIFLQKETSFSQDWLNLKGKFFPEPSSSNCNTIGKRSHHIPIPHTRNPIRT